MTNAITYLTPRDRNCLAYSVADTLRYLNGFPSLNSAGVLDLVSSPVVKQEQLPHQLLQALLPATAVAEAKTPAIITTWKELKSEIETHSRLLGESYGIMFAPTLPFGGSSGAAEEEQVDPSLDQRLEILFQLAIAVLQQRHMLHQSHSAPQPRNPEIEVGDGPAVDSSNRIPTDDGVPMKLPSHFSPEQRALVAACYKQMHRDYENRLQGLHQRLCILKSNCGTCTEKQQHLPICSYELTAEKMMTMTDLEESLSRAVSTSLPARDSEVGSNQPTPNSCPPDALPLQIVSDRGRGRVDTTENRSPVMPEWTDERREGGKTSGRSRKDGGRGRGQGRNDNKKRSN